MRRQQLRLLKMKREGHIPITPLISALVAQNYSDAIRPAYALLLPNPRLEELQNRDWNLYANADGE